MIRICFVCHGNICRSPTAEGIMSQLLTQAGLAEHVQVDSAGLGAYGGQPPDERSTREAHKRGVLLRGQSRRFEISDFDEFEYVIAADRDNHQALCSLTVSEAWLSRIHLLRDFDPDAPSGSSVPDPYSGGPNGFRDVFDVCEAACNGLLDHLRRHHDLPTG